MSERLASLLMPVRSETFLQCYQAREHLFIRRGRPNFYDDVLRIEDLDIFLQSETTPTAFFDAVRTGGRLPAETWSRERHSQRGYQRVVEPKRVFNLFSENTTLILNQLNHSIPRLAQTCRELTRELGLPVQANAYITPPLSRGFDRHIDDHDVLILQVFGRKCWTLYPIGKDAVELELQTGDFLYIPSGLAHIATCPDEASIHVTVGLHPPYGYRLLEELGALARTHPDFQKPAPPLSAPLEARQDFVARFLSDVRKLLNDATVNSLLERRLDMVARNQSHGWSGRLRDILRLREITPDTVVCSRDEIVTRVEDCGKTLLVQFAGQTTEIPAFLAMAWNRIREHSPFAIRDLPGMMTETGKVEFVRPFIQNGLLTILEL